MFIFFKVNGSWDMPRAHKLFKDRQAVSALPATLLCFLAGLNNKKNETKKKRIKK